MLNKVSGVTSLFTTTMALLQLRPAATVTKSPSQDGSSEGSVQD
jgi:hypothetical protein